MRINGDYDPLDQVAPRCERLWEPHAHLAGGTRSRQPALIDALPRRDVVRGGVSHDPKDFNTAEMPLNRLGKPALHRAGRRGPPSPTARRRAGQWRLRGE